MICFFFQVDGGKSAHGIISNVERKNVGQNYTEIFQLPPVYDPALHHLVNDSKTNGITILLDYE